MILLDDLSVIYMIYWATDSGLEVWPMRKLSLHLHENFEDIIVTLGECLAQLDGSIIVVACYSVAIESLSDTTQPDDVAIRSSRESFEDCLFHNATIVV